MAASDVRTSGREKHARSRLSAMQQRFVEELLKDPKRVATEAAKRAGYAPGSAKVRAAEMRAKPAVQAAIAAADARSARNLDLTVDRIKQRVLEAFENKGATRNEIARLGELLAKMTPGALVPQKLEHNVGRSLEQLIVDAAKPQPTEGSK